MVISSQFSYRPYSVIHVPCPQKNLRLPKAFASRCLIAGVSISPSSSIEFMTTWKLIQFLWRVGGGRHTWHGRHNRYWTIERKADMFQTGGFQSSASCSYSSQCWTRSTLRSSTFQGAPVRYPATVKREQKGTCLVVEARYRGKGTDRSAVTQFRRHDSDSGSTEVQISQLTARISQLTTHLQQHRKDHATRRGLDTLLSRRRHFMQYLYKKDRSKYDNIISELNIRPLRIQAGRGVVVKATEEGLVVDEAASSAAAAGEGDQ